MTVDGMVHAAARVSEIRARFGLLDRPVAAAAETGGTVHPSWTEPRFASVAGGEGDWAARLPDEGRPWAGAIEDAAREAGVDPRLFAALVRAESGFRPEARSRAGAEGLAQLMPATAAGLGVDPHDPLENLSGGARYLRQQLDRFGSADLALAAYNAGPGRVAQAGGVPAIPETQAYVRRVLDYYQELS